GAGSRMGAWTSSISTPPSNTGVARAGGRLTTSRDPAGDRTGFGGRRYRTLAEAGPSFSDRFTDYLGFLDPRLRESRRLLAPHGTLYLHLDAREVHYAKVRLDAIFGGPAFLNEVIWAYDFGGRGRRRWAPKHDSILVYVRTPGRHHFDPDAV
ncbi:DNA methylase N-4/N-6 domain protein, partial [mine drainage metagenome]